jgi:uncharacterized membrane protein
MHEATLKPRDLVTFSGFLGRVLTLKRAGCMSTIQFELKRRLASTRNERVTVVAGIAALSFGFALFLGWFVGAWMILPFAGVEVGCLAFAFWWIEYRSKDCDRIEVDETSVSVTRIRGKHTDTHTFARAWVQIDIERDRSGRELGVRMRQSGRSVAIGEFLRGVEQRAAAMSIRAALNQAATA